MPFRAKRTVQQAPALRLHGDVETKGSARDKVHNDPKTTDRWKIEPRIPTRQIGDKRVEARDRMDQDRLWKLPDKRSSASAVRAAMQVPSASYRHP